MIRTRALLGVTSALITHLRRHVVGYLALALVLGIAPAYAAGSMVGSAQIKKNAVKSRHIGNGQVTTTDLKKGAVTASKVRPNSLTGAQIKESTLAIPKVREFYGTPGTITTTTTVQLTGLTKEEVDRSSFLVFYNTAAESADSWYPAPGLGSGAIYNTRWFIGATGPGAYYLTLRFTTPDGSGGYASQINLTKLRVVVTTLPAP
ncbi:hypothetical protein ACLM5J_12040 [Nocardioides sp. Bht2]|uniref:hypothetical protein n=1 Tax=Nocardioides sp. Bht2 TaxID=3392297 RepID=UPI0039B3C421